MGRKDGFIAVHMRTETVGVGSLGSEREIFIMMTSNQSGKI